MIDGKEVTELAKYLHGYLFPLRNDTIEDCTVIASALVWQGYKKVEEDKVIIDKKVHRLLVNKVKKQAQKIKEIAKEILTALYKKAQREIDFQDGTVNTQLEPLYFGISNGVQYMLDEIKLLAEKHKVELE